MFLLSRGLGEFVIEGQPPWYPVVGGLTVIGAQCRVDENTPVLKVQAGGEGSQGEKTHSKKLSSIFLFS